MRALTKQYKPGATTVRLFALLACIGAAVCISMAARSGIESPARTVTSLPQLLTLPSQRLADIPIERMNLLCGADLLRTTPEHAEKLLANIPAWAERVRSETDRHLYRFRENPAEFENSEAFFRMLMLTVVLAEDFAVHYNPDRKTEPTNARMGDGFFGDPRQVFLQGLLGSAREGTCSSMPVLYVAVGRKLGYPLKLVSTKGHLFVRWDAPGERFNIEATARGLSRFQDEYYRHWPFEVTPEEEAAEVYLKSLTPPEELAVFMSIRGMCLHDSGRLSEAAESFAAAANLAPACRSYPEMAAHLAQRPQLTFTQTTR